MFKFALVDQEGEVVSHFESAESNCQAGEEMRASGNVRYRITSVIPIELVEEFHHSPLCGLLEVEPLELAESET